MMPIMANSSTHISLQFILSIITGSKRKGCKEQGQERGSMRWVRKKKVKWSGWRKGRRLGDTIN